MNEFNFDRPKVGEKIAMIIYEKRGKFRITEEEEQLLFAPPHKGDLIQKLLEIRKEKKKREIASL